VKPITFSAQDMLINSNYPTEDIVVELSNQLKTQYTQEESVFSITSEMIKGEGLWVSIRYGNTKPYSPELVSKDYEVAENQRHIDQAELRNQLFLFYSLRSKQLYTTNLRLKSTVSEYFKQCYGGNVVVCNIYQTLDEFLERVKTINDVRLIARRNLFSELTDLFQNSTDICGLGGPEQIDIDIKFAKEKLTDQFKDFMHKWLLKRDQGELDKLICVGRDDSEMEQIFNTSTLVSKIEVEASKDKYGMYDPEKVKDGIISKVMKLNV
jgi:hypothetical protein